MKRILVLLLSLVVAFGFVGCAPQDNNNDPNASIAPAGNSVKTGMAVISSMEKSTPATADKEGTIEVSSTVVALTIDNDGKIVKCKIDTAQTKIGINAKGKITTPLDKVYASKQELGDEYGMKKASSLGKEWYEQANALADYVQGKTIDEVKGIKISEEGTPADEPLSSSVTMKIGGYISAIEKAANNAQDIGAKAADKLGLGVVTTIDKSSDATSEKEGVAQAYTHYAATTFGTDNKITSNIIDASQTNVNFTTDGKITTDLKTPLQTKNELGDKYGMKKASSIGKEWYEEAASFAKYSVGKSIDELKGISLNEEGVPSEAELKSSVTISVIDMIEVISKSSSNAI